MLAKIFRLTQEKDFKKIKTAGKSFFSPFFRLRFITNNLGYNRFTVVISTKVSKKATTRNRLKRQLREIIRLNKSKIKESFDCILIVQNSALKKTYLELENNFLGLLSKARLIK